VGFFDRFSRKRRVISDPLFGELTFEHGGWSRQIPFAGSREPVWLWIDAGEQGPTEAHWRRFQDLERRYAELCSRIGEVLWELFEPYRTNWLNDVPQLGRLNGPADMLASTTLDNIHIRETGGIHLMFGLVPGLGWDDAMLNIAVDGSTVVPISVDD
jgi:hypothetical protein